MDEDQVSYLNYEKLVDAALMNVVKSCLEQASKEGLKGDHHFYITFLTHHAGVRIPEYLKDQYPEEMTIVLQHQFENLEVNKEGFKVELVFDEEKEHIEIPFQAIVNFYDPSVDFSIDFNPEETDLPMLSEAIAPSKKGTKGNTASQSGTVVSLDQFRNKHKKK
jgi:hypothetical protein